jgi:hypothetical protein
MKAREDSVPVATWLLVQISSILHRWKSWLGRESRREMKRGEGKGGKGRGKLGRWQRVEVLLLLC